MLPLLCCLFSGILVVCGNPHVNLPTGKFTRDTDGTLLFSIDDYSGTHSIDLHYSVNKPLPNVQSGDWNVRLTKTSNGWQHTNPKVTLKAGDVVNYWVLFLTVQGGYQETDLSCKIEDPTTTSTTTVTTPTTKPTTKPTTVSTTPHKPSNTTSTTAAPSNHTTHTPPVTTTQTPGTCSSYPCVIFEDQFDKFDLGVWEHEITAGGGGNWEFEMYVNNRSNSWVNNSKLHIRPTLTSDIYGEEFLSSGLLDIWGNTPASQCTGPQFYGCFRQGTGTNYVNPVQSARIRTVKSFNFRYGRVEVEAKLPKGDWLWPAIWMLPKNEHYGIWPQSGEIDIVEGRGNANYKDKDGKEFGTKWMASTLHWGPYFSQNQYKRTHVEKIAENGDYASGFHKYAVEWDDSSITFFLDNEEILKIDPGQGGFWKFGEFEKNVPGSANPWASDGSYMAPFDREFFLIINVAVGGTNSFFPDDAVNGGYPKPWRDQSPTAPREFWNAHAQWYPTWKFPDDTLQVNYVKVTKLKPDP